MASSINTIDLDVDTIDLSEYPVYHYEDKPRADAYDKTLCQDNKDFTNFLNKCLLLEQTFEMEKIIGKILLPAYIHADDEYKKSQKFARVVKKALQRLIDEPKKKYSHISDVTETLKFHVKKLPKKRVDFVTLSSTTSVLGKTKKTNRKRVVDNKITKKSKKPKLDVIAVDSEDDDLIPVDDTPSNTVGDDLMIVDDTGKTTVKEDLTILGDSAKKINDDNLIAAHDIAKKLFEEIAGFNKVNNMEVDNSLINTEQKPNKTKVVNEAAATKPMRTNKSDSKIKNKIRDKLKLKKSKYKPAITFESDDENYMKTLVKIKDKKSKHNASSIGNLQIEKSNDDIPIEIPDSQDINVQEEVQFQNNESNTVSNVNTRKLELNKDAHNDKENLENNENLCDSNDMLLVPRMEIILEEKIPSKLNDKRHERIKAIETEILKYKKKIADLELAEVTEDSYGSAYIRCDKLQAHIVKLYKELCTLNDAEPVKGRNVRLRHAEGLPQGPVLRLETFLNKQADEDGVAPFPDYADVVRCVEKSNVKDGLGWSKTKVHKEAQALFEYCGRALQKRRQRREWKDLRSQLSREEFEADPAASDPELAAKLELNRQLALKKEAEILEKFSRMETASGKVAVQQNDNKAQDIGNSDSSDDKLEQAEMEKPYKNPESVPNVQINEEIGAVIRIKEEPYEVPIYFALNDSIAIEISDSDSSEDSCGEW